MKIDKKKLKRAVKIFYGVSIAAEVLNLALTKCGEKQGDFSREFPDCAEEIAKAVEKAKNEKRSLGNE